MSLCLDWFYKDYSDFRTKPYRKQMYTQLQLNLSFPTTVSIITERVFVMKFMIWSNLIEMLFLHIEVKTVKITGADSKHTSSVQHLFEAGC